MNLESIKGIGPKALENLQKLNIFNIEGLLSYYPYRYNFINIEPLRDTEESIYIKGLIVDSPRVFYIKRNLNKLSFRFYINNEVVNVTIFNRAFLKQHLTREKQVILYGKYNKLKNTFVASDIKFNVNENTIEPIYHLTDGVKNNNLIKMIQEALSYNNVPDYIPSEYNDLYNFISKKDAIQIIHMPHNEKDINLARLKLIYEELFMFMFKINYLKRINKQVLGINRDIKIEEVDNFISELPFKLTEAQITSIKVIYEDLTSKERMNRLLLGDVGTGKTIVAVVGMYINYLSGYQSALMAPTEILAIQHFKTISNLFTNYDIKVELLTGKTTKKEKDRIYSELENGNINIIIGTHALITDKLSFKKLGLVVTDEQHRFGVNARLTLQNKGITPDVLYLSATPIPRTYALTIYGDLNISMIKTKPVGRIEIKTVLKKEKEIKDVLYKMLEELKLGHQIYVVSPLIENNEELDLKSVEELKEKLSSAFREIKIEILHGRLNNKEKESIMKDFKDGITKILISTTVIEVGIDVSNATMMVIYNAERFGLATLHQLRGRVGRNEIQSYCYLISDHDSERLHVLEESNDGFYISEKDFELRGSGDIFGVKQSGDMNFKIADIKNDYKILLQAKNDSEDFIANNKYINNELYLKIIKEIEFIN